MGNQREIYEDPLVFIDPSAATRTHASGPKAVNCVSDVATFRTLVRRRLIAAESVDLC